MLRGSILFFAGVCLFAAHSAVAQQLPSASPFEPNQPVGADELQCEFPFETEAPAEHVPAFHASPAPVSQVEARREVAPFTKLALEEQPHPDSDLGFVTLQSYTDPTCTSPTGKNAACAAPTCTDSTSVYQLMSTCDGCQDPTCECCNGSDCDGCCCLKCYGPEQPKPCEECPRVNNLNPAWNLKIGGTATLDALFNTARPVAAGTPFFLAPKGPFEDDTFDIHARGSTLYFLASGPKIGDFETGALVMFCLYNDSITVDRYGFLPLFAFGELKNEEWRVAAGLQLDIFAPLIPTVLPISILAASGNAGLYRGQLRVERFLYPAEDQQITFTAGISDANPTLFNNDVLSEDNGLPNVEGRVAWGVGQPKVVGFAAQRPFEVGVSGVAGQLRTTDIAPPRQVVADVWGVAVDARWRVSENWGFQGEAFVGQGLGTYGGEVLQTTNSVTFEAIGGSGGWAEVYCYLTQCVHTHWGYGIDTPDTGDLAPGQVSRNDTIFANLLWDVSQSLRLGLELTRRQTEYIVLQENEGFGIHGQMQWKF